MLRREAHQLHGRNSGKSVAIALIGMLSTKLARDTVIGQHSRRQ